MLKVNSNFTRGADLSDPFRKRSRRVERGRAVW